MKANWFAGGQDSSDGSEDDFHFLDNDLLANNYQTTGTGTSRGTDITKNSKMSGNVPGQKKFDFGKVGSGEDQLDYPDAPDGF